MNFEKERLFKFFLAVIFVLCIADIASTEMIINHGGTESEQNDFARAIVENYGIAGFAFYRIAATFLLLGFFNFLYEKKIQNLKFADASFCFAAIMLVVSALVVFNNVNVLCGGKALSYNPWLMIFLFITVPAVVVFIENAKQLLEIKNKAS